MKTIIKNKFALIEPSTKGENIFIKESSLVGDFGNNLIKVKKRNSNENKFKKIGLSPYSINSFMKTPEFSNFILLKSAKKTFISFDLKNDIPILVRLNDMVFLESGIILGKKHRNFYSKNSKNTLVELQGEGKVVFETNSEAPMKILLEENTLNKINPDDILIFSKDLKYQIKKERKSKNSVTFSGNGYIIID